MVGPVVNWGEGREGYHIVIIRETKEERLFRMILTSI